ncbi:hypothetical protein [Plantactinospora sp. KBS50]|uniref:hypothetical protein n=1 Tax=Plantactinospora sp. KBS50 TaxID=2024580 RepID=UPI000BAB127D|nr:hypothetical protein [Plantactinospora sp. KBS50]ASW53602.1 hypothetical protein CIK06_04470 [Plantactinospora sp. KBS50]
MIVRMWEARAEPKGFAELIAWVCDVAVPEFEHDPRHAGSEVFSSTDDRIVVISRWRGAPPSMPDPPPLLVARPPHEWDFTPVDR